MYYTVCGFGVYMVFVCLYADLMYFSIHIYVIVCICIDRYKRVPPSLRHLPMYVCIYVYVCPPQIHYVCIYPPLSTMYVSLYVCMFLCLYVCMYVCIHLKHKQNIIEYRF